MPPITTTEPMFEREEGNKKETVGIATYEICDSIRFNLDCYLETMVSAEELFLAAATYPYFQYPENQATKESTQWLGQTMDKSLQIYYSTLNLEHLISDNYPINHNFKQ